MKLFMIAFLALSVYSASAQIKTGSIVVVGFLKNKLVIAADSRGTYKTSRPKNDDQCKIAALSNHAVFASTGAIGYGSGGIGDPVSSWANVKEAGNASDAVGVRTHGKERIEQIADAWVQIVSIDWFITYLFHPEVLDAMEDNVLSIGFFATAEDGEIFSTLRAIVFDGTTFSGEQRQFTTGPFCAFGKVGVYNELMTPASDLAKSEAEHWTISPTLTQRLDWGTLRAIRIADLTAAYEPSGDVGGHIDAVELWDNGSIHWVARKCQCPDHED
jgi:hypothetical protein